LLHLSVCLLALIDRSAWKSNSPKLDFRLTEFSELRGNKCPPGKYIAPCELARVPGFDARRGGETPLLPTGNSDGRSAVRRRILGFVMLMMLVGMSARLAFAGIEILK
jgi:hypothetical protein